ncbi:KH domain-containing, RNA-binding, signal transduction-associated protein 2-like [Stomoxys calcitrans]|uniref:KH domain-containing, RNA-binding, signal transduction-associated protein 2-like n=1 Tax=Stomoxys calcitrans TaxID=35570 RepID=UPI0027E22055|nr:KH domain-containing, RNA-binding, signal transduction-associated protein 2-like [Stomoxys calcitrans]
MTSENDKQDMHAPKVNQVAQEYIDALLKEEARLPEDFPLCSALIRDAIDRIYLTGRIPGKELKADVFQQKPIKLTQTVYIPVKQYPHFNFLGKILGPKGNTLKRLHQETMCSIAIRGRRSMRDQEREEELGQSGDPAFNHLNKNLYVELSTVAPPAEAYARIVYALTEIRKYIIPDKNDEISQEQYRELVQMDLSMAKTAGFGSKVVPKRSVFQKLAALGGSEDYTNEQYDSDEDEPAAAPPTTYGAYKKATFAAEVRTQLCSELHGPLNI